MAYDFARVEKKWIEKFRDFDGYKGTDFDKREKKYVLAEFPYPSGEGLHVGHAFTMTGSDVYARFMRKKGHNVVFPMGFDAFGLPAENFAIKTGVQPQATTDRVIKLFREQMDRLGFSFDWEREVNTTDPGYYKWTQWIFTKLFEKGLAYKKLMLINWCPSCKIGLANEEVIDGKCERCGTQTERRNLSQWVVKITDYADRLIDGLNNTDFIEKVRAAQINWIDRREGTLIKFGEIEVFTTRPDTLGGVEFVAVSPDHPIVQKYMVDEVKKYVDEFKKRDVKDRGERKKTGVLLPIKVINPLNEKEVPVYVADYVSIDFGTGAIMGVPSHDTRDREFAEAIGIDFDANFAPSENNVGEKKVTYHLRDWIFSRQHYWGEPIPMIDCSKCGWVPVPEDQLPVRLPEVEKYQPTDTGESPLAAIESFVKTTCPKCGGVARRETDTMPNWAGSDWYFLRYCDNQNDKVLADLGKMKYWLPVDVYVGGDEHNTLHLLYSRFIYQFLWDLEVVPKEYPEPYKKRLSHGVILAPNGKRMSKSKGNVISPDTEVEKYGADVLRTYMMFMGPFDATMAWNERALIGVKRYLERFYDLATSPLDNEPDEKTKSLINKLVIVAEADFGQFKFNTVVARLMETLNEITKNSLKLGREELRRILVVLSHFSPFITAEIWEKLGFEGNVHSAVWPTVDEKDLREDEVSVSVQVNGKLRGVILTKMNVSQDEVIEMAKNVPNVSKHLDGQEIFKVIYIKAKTLNFVLK